MFLKQRLNNTGKKYNKSKLKGLIKSNRHTLISSTNAGIHFLHCGRGKCRHSSRLTIGAGLATKPCNTSGKTCLIRFQDITEFPQETELVTPNIGGHSSEFWEGQAIKGSRSSLPARPGSAAWVPWREVLLPDEPPTSTCVSHSRTTPACTANGSSRSETPG